MILTAKECKDLGIVIVEGDVYKHRNGSSLMAADSISITWFKRGCVAANNAIVTEFKWRPIDTLEAKPLFRFETKKGGLLWRPLTIQPQTECEFNNQSVYSKSADTLGHCANQTIIPDMTIKPVFTQEMFDAGITPPIGSEFVLGEGKSFIYLGFYCSKHFAVHLDGVSKGFPAQWSVTPNFLPAKTPKQKVLDTVVARLKSNGVDTPNLHTLHILYELNLLVK